MFRGAVSPLWWCLLSIQAIVDANGEDYVYQTVRLSWDEF
jgi:hypothetical protein